MIMEDTYFTIFLLENITGVSRYNPTKTYQVQILNPA